MQNSKSYFVLPNTAFGLSSEEFSVLAYLLSIPTAKKRVRQQTIAEKCNIGSRNTVTKAINSLLAKGYIFTKIRTRRVNYWYGTNIYYLNEDAVCDFSKGYTLIQRAFLNMDYHRHSWRYMLSLQSQSTQSSATAGTAIPIYPKAQVCPVAL